MKLTTYSINYTQPKPFKLLVCDNEECSKHKHGGYYVTDRAIKCSKCKQDLSLVPNATEGE